MPDASWIVRPAEWEPHIGGLLQSGCLEPGFPWSHDGYEIAAVVNATPECPPLPVPNGRLYLRLPLDDAPFREEWAEPIRAASLVVWLLMSRGRSVLVHCGAGINRASLVSGRALEWSGLRAQEAIDLLRARRPGTLSNPSFEAWLREQGRA